jgi:flagellar basal-body rod modification protein FlgD
MSTPLISGSSPAPDTTDSKNLPAGPKIDKNMFLQLIVAQLRNQNPLSPTDSVQFAQQLAQFQQMEQSVNTGQDIAAIRQDMDQFLAANTGSVSKP